MHKLIQNTLNFLLKWTVVLFLLIVGLYGFYALWDNSRVYAAAEDVRTELLAFKPKVSQDSQEEGLSFDAVQAINPDVTAWVTLDNTHIDHPVLHDESNFTYINTDVYGNFALAGSIFLDCRNTGSYDEPYSLLYGHHMENGGMFGDLDLYKDPDFFRDNTTGTLLVPQGAYELEVFACLLVPASDEHIFQPDRWRTDIQALIPYLRENAMHLHTDTLDALEQADEPKILALSTCSTEFTDARTIVLAVMKSWEQGDSGG